MPIAVPRSSSSPRLHVTFHSTVGDFLSATYPTLNYHERSANIILANALKSASAVDLLTEFQFTADAEVHPASSTSKPDGGSFWLTLWSTQPQSSFPVLDMVLSCTSWILGNYPIFLWTPNTAAAMSPAWLTPRVSQLVQSLLDYTAPQRVFSVFGLASLVKCFAKHWTEATGIMPFAEPFYAALFTYCTAETLRPYRDPHYRIPPGHLIRKAASTDLDGVARLCKEFADDSRFFPLDIEGATIEAKELITKGLLWVYEVRGEIAAICAATRSSLRVTAITKVYTKESWRGQRLAEHLVRSVTQRLLASNKQFVVLYVGHENSAKRVYDRVGYVGLNGADRPEGVEDALELGFVGAERGHW
ncbi:hypothetical protein PLICRDRAFT_99428 [Plicaturopsis crispa FD-325 SS-3]|nr:hypothetical protein PLICRDRAFT_99428 [Plicaturopsis crispa FD-325 SS-3]